MEVARCLVIRNRMIWLSFAVFAVSMFLPMHYLGFPGEDFDYYSTREYFWFAGSNDSAVIDAGSYLINTPSIPLTLFWMLVMGIVSNGFLSVSNIIYLSVLHGLWRSKDTARLVSWTCLSIGISLLFYLNHSLVSIPASYDSYLITDKGAGYFLWLSSLIILSGAEMYELKYCPRRSITVHQEESIGERKNLRGALFVRCMIMLSLLAFISSLIFPMYGLEAHRSPGITEDEYHRADALGGAYTCGKVFLSGALSLPKDIARLVVTGEIHFRLLMTFTNVLLFGCMYLVHKHKAGRKTHVAMLVAVIYIICFCVWDYQEFQNWAWDWTPALSMSEKHIGCYLWLSSFVLMYAAVAYQRGQTYRLTRKRRIVTPEDKAMRRNVLVLFAIYAFVAFPLLYILLIIICMFLSSFWGAF